MNVKLYLQTNELRDKREKSPEVCKHVHIINDNRLTKMIWQCALRCNDNHDLNERSYKRH